MGRLYLFVTRLATRLRSGTCRLPTRSRFTTAPHIVVVRLNLVVITFVINAADAQVPDSSFGIFFRVICCQCRDHSQYDPHFTQHVSSAILLVRAHLAADIWLQKTHI